MCAKCTDIVKETFPYLEYISTYSSPLYLRHQCGDNCYSHPLQGVVLTAAQPGHNQLSCIKSDQTHGKLLSTEHLKPKVSLKYTIWTDLSNRTSCKNRSLQSESKQFFCN